MIKTFFGGSKIQVISPLLIDNKLASDFKEKANRFNFLIVSVYLLTMVVNV